MYKAPSSRAPTAARLLLTGFSLLLHRPQRSTFRRLLALPLNEMLIPSGANVLFSMRIAAGQVPFSMEACALWIARPCTSPHKVLQPYFWPRWFPCSRLQALLRLRSLRVATSPQTLLFNVHGEGKPRKYAKGHQDHVHLKASGTSGRSEVSREWRRGACSETTPYFNPTNLRG